MPSTLILYASVEGHTERIAQRMAAILRRGSHHVDVVAVGGKLDFYDLNPPDPKRMVDNKEDEDARTPLAAHGEHWSNPMLSEVLKLAIVKTAPVLEPSA